MSSPPGNIRDKLLEAQIVFLSDLHYISQHLLILPQKTSVSESLKVLSN